MKIVYSHIKNSQDFVGWFPQFRVERFSAALLGYAKIQFPNYYSIFLFDNNKFPQQFNRLNSPNYEGRKLNNDLVIKSSPILVENLYSSDIIQSFLVTKYKGCLIYFSGYNERLNVISVRLNRAFELLDFNAVIGLKLDLKRE